jgi:hypothetical protein
VSKYLHYLASSSGLPINPIDKLNTTNLTLLQLVQSIQHAPKPTRANLGGMHSKLLARKELRSQFPENLRELEVLWLRRHVHTTGPFECFAGESVAESGLWSVLVGFREVDGSWGWMDGS